eukprot:2918696-Rhodomonas_salina.2
MSAYERCPMADTDNEPVCFQKSIEDDDGGLSPLEIRTDPLLLNGDVTVRLFALNVYDDSICGVNGQLQQGAFPLEIARATECSRFWPSSIISNLAWPASHPNVARGLDRNADPVQLVRAREVTGLRVVPHGLPRR